MIAFLRRLFRRNYSQVEWNAALCRVLAKHPVTTPRQRFKGAE